MGPAVAVRQVSGCKAPSCAHLSERGTPNAGSAPLVGDVNRHSEPFVIRQRKAIVGNYGKENRQTNHRPVPLNPIVY